MDAQSKTNVFHLIIISIYVYIVEFNLYLET